MSHSVSCSRCQRAYTFSDDKAGKRFHCKDCGELVTVPLERMVQAELVDEWGDDEEAEEDSPFAPPKSSGSLPRKRGKRKPMGWLVTGLPASFLIGASIIGILITILYAISQFVASERPKNMRDAEFAGYVAGTITVFLLAIVSNIATLLGGYHLLNRKSYHMAMTGAVLACIPCLSPCFYLGIPIGIWCLVVLMLDDVKRSFKG